jgi:hypothetical protein
VPGRQEHPVGAWPIIIADTIDEPGALGYHADQHHQPYALVKAGAGWSVTASHELLEMLADPWGRRLWAAQEPVAAGIGRVRFLVEVCDPVERGSYPIMGIGVSDFVLPAWYHTARSHKPLNHGAPCPSRARWSREATSPGSMTGASGGSRLGLALGPQFAVSVMSPG